MSSESLLAELKQTRPFRSSGEEGMVALLKTADHVRRLVETVVCREGITAQQYNVLRILRGAGDEGLPTLEIGQRMIEQAPGITRLLDRLERKRLVTRERCTRDRRQVLCRITPEGLDVLERLAAPIAALNKAALERLGEKRMQMLLQLLDLMRQ